MPRRNRRAPERCARPIRSMTESQRHALARFAEDHLAAHAEAVTAGARLDLVRGFPNLVVTASEHPATSVRFLSAGDSLDRLALKLAAGPSEPARTLAA